MIGWRPDRAAAAVTGYEMAGTAGQVVAALERQPPYAAWRFVAVLSGLVEPLAVFGNQDPEAYAFSARPAVWVTVAGFWRGTGHSFVTLLPAGDGYEAMALAQARYGAPTELQMLCAVSGRCDVLLRAEQRPAGGWQVGTPARRGMGFG